MIKRETIKQAIDAISARDPEIGYALDEMLGRGTIDAPPPGQDPLLDNDFYFLFDRYKARVSRFLYINKGNVPIEERLLIKYGELLKKQELLEQGEDVETPQARKTIRQAGLHLMVAHEIDYAAARLANEAPDRSAAAGSFDRRRLIDFFEALKQDRTAIALSDNNADPLVLFAGTVDADIPALFTRFPFQLDSLLQVADINIEFFHVRFILNRLIKGGWQNLFTCIVDNRIVGIIYLDRKRQLFRQSLEIKFVAARRSSPATADCSRPIVYRGVGTFLVAGTWLYWQTALPAVRELLLDSEIGARSFYAGIGFSPRGFAEFVLTTPKGYLLKAIVQMSRNRADLSQRSRDEIERAVRRQVKSLARMAADSRKPAAREAALAALAECLQPDTGRQLSAATLRFLKRYRHRIPEAGELTRRAAAPPDRKDG